MNTKNLLLQEIEILITVGAKVQNISNQYRILSITRENLLKSDSEYTHKIMEIEEMITQLLDILKILKNELDIHKQKLQDLM